jgi:hypothetical protein
MSVERKSAVNIDHGLYRKLKSKARREGKVTYKMIEQMLAQAIGYTLGSYEEEDEEESQANNQVLETQTA